MSHIFVRGGDDTIVPFLSLMIKSVAKAGVDTELVVPRERGLPSRERDGATDIYRFYAPKRMLSYKGDLHEQVFRGFRNKILFAVFLLSFLANSLAVVARTKPDIIHAHWWVPSGVIAAFVGMVTGVPYVITSHGTDVFILRRFRFLRPLAKFVIKRSKKMIVISTPLKTLLVEGLGIEPSKIEIIPEPLEIELFSGAEIKKRCENRILAVARLVERKGLDYLIRACAELKKRGMKFNLTIIGEGPEEAKLRSLIGELGLRADVEMIKSVPHSKIGGYFKKSDVFLLPTVTDWKGETEGLGVVILEALCCKRPVIATRTGGITDIIRDGETGLLVDEKDSAGLADAIEKILKNGGLRERLAKKGYEEVVRKFSPEMVSKGITTVYDDALR